MVCFNIGHHRYHRLQMKERGITLIGFSNQIAATTQLCIGANTIDPATDDEGRIAASFGQYCGN